VLDSLKYKNLALPLVTLTRVINGDCPLKNGDCPH